MATATVEIQMPQMGESVTEGTVLEWHKQKGDRVEEGETVVEISTDKVDAEVPAPASGTLTKILKQVDETVEVGSVLAELDPAGDPPASGNGASAPAPETSQAGDGGSSEDSEESEKSGDGGSAEESDGSDFVEGGGEGDADIGDESEGASSATPGKEESPVPGGGGTATAQAAGDAPAEGESVTLTMPEMGESVTEGTV